MDKIFDAIYLAIDEINDTLPKSKQIAKNPNSVLFGRDGVLDSIALVNLIVGVESNIEDLLDKTITLADEKAMSQANSPFRTVQTLADYIKQILG